MFIQNRYLYQCSSVELFYESNDWSAILLRTFEKSTSAFFIEKDFR